MGETKMPTQKTRSEIDAEIHRISTEMAYRPDVIQAGLRFARLKNRFEDPPGVFDRARRFHASERSSIVEAARTPSRAWPYSEMRAARTAAHVAEMQGCIDNVTEVRRIGEAWDRVYDGATVEDARKLLKPGIRARQAEAELDREEFGDEEIRGADREADDREAKAWAVKVASRLYAKDREVEVGRDLGEV
jgi:hypothetical protein